MLEAKSLAIYLQDRSFKLKDRSSIRGRLSELGKSGELHYENFRIFQLTLICCPCILALFCYLMGLTSLFVSSILILTSSIITVISTELHLSRRVKRRRLALEEEFSSVMEIFTLSVGAGMSPTSAMKRISERGEGILAEKFREVIQEIESGIPIATALDRMARHLNSLLVRRFVDVVVISLSRGTPLVDALRHSTQEARNHERIKLLEAASKSEISMMIPVVFLILPISILFALFPSFTTLNLFT
jgi:tight adherence protein C